MSELSPPSAAVICAGLVQIYQGSEEPIVALRNVDLEVGAGELIALLGPSGSGKSTLLAVLSGLLRPTAGKVLVGGHDMTRLDETGLRRLRGTELALLLQNPLHNLLPYATARENLAFAARGVRGRDWQLRWSADELIELFELGDLARTPVHVLSGGQQQRVAIASAFATSPRILLADEPTTQLDADGRDQVVAALLRANQLTGATVIVVTHDIAVAEGLPRTVSISHGAIGAEGRGRSRFAVIGRDGTVQMPPDVTARYPAGTLFRVQMDEDVVELHPEEEK